LKELKMSKTKAPRPCPETEQDIEARLEQIKRDNPGTHPTTWKVINILKRNSRTPLKEIADELGMNVRVARGWVVVARETMAAWRGGY
jgi:hypothetical protein